MLQLQVLYAQSWPRIGQQVAQLLVAPVIFGNILINFSFVQNWQWEENRGGQLWTLHGRGQEDSS